MSLNAGSEISAGAAPIRKKRLVSSSSPGEIAFKCCNYFLLSVFTFICLFPFLNTLANSFSSSHAILAGQVVLFPVQFQLDAIKAVLLDKSIIRAFLVTIFITVVGTALNMVFTIITAYPLSIRALKGRRVFMNYMIFTMMFSGGMIPGFLVVKWLHMLDTIWALLIPGLISSFNVIIMKTFFQNMPEELREAAIVDGCGNIRYLISILLPISGASLATISLFYAVGHWNSYFSAVLYIDNQNLYPLQVKLRNILLLAQMDTSLETMQSDNGLNVIQESLKAATIAFATVPILVVYPFLQKYFVKGALLGSVKG